jgi:GntR family transcriptional regulator/MocR family aminotransferase
MPLQRRLDVLAWADRQGALIFEDDYDSEFRYSGRPVEALQGLDRAGRVLYAGTFSKLMFPALRLGYLVLPAALVSPVVTAKAVCDTGCAALEQLALADFIQEGHFDRHLRRSRARNARRREALLAALAQHLGDRIEVTGVNAGLHVLVWLRGFAARRLPALRRRAAEQGVGVYPVTPYYSEPPKTAGLLLGFASLQEKEIDEGIRRLAHVLNSRDADDTEAPRDSTP